MKSKEQLLFLGDCRDTELIELLFDSVSEFARLVEKHGNSFTTLGSIVVKYNRKNDRHSFYEIVSKK
jgi:hypothetical protein